MNFDQALSWLLSCNAEVIDIGCAGDPFQKGRLIRLNESIGVFKKVYSGRYNSFHVIANLVIPAGALVVITGGNNYHKCRAERAVVHSMYGQNNERMVKNAFSWHNPRFKYVDGCSVTAKKFDKNPDITCSRGIHFYCNLQSAFG